MEISIQELTTREKAWTWNRKKKKKKKVDLTQTGSSIYQSIPKSSISAVWDLHRIHMLNLCADVQIWTTKNRWNPIWVSTAMTQTGHLFFLLLYQRTLQKHKCATVIVCKVPFKFFLGVRDVFILHAIETEPRSPTRACCTAAGGWPWIMPLSRHIQCPACSWTRDDLRLLVWLSSSSGCKLLRVAH